MKELIFFDFDNKFYFDVYKFESGCDKFFLFVSILWLTNIWLCVNVYEC